MSSALEIYEDIDNPLDSIEDIFLSNDWVFSRPHPDELNIQISGTHGVYGLTFIWQDKYSALQLFCEFDMQIPKHKMTEASQVLRRINDRLWLGHFDVPEDHKAHPCFRHTSLLRETSGTNHIEDLVEIALAECEKHYPVFALLCSASNMNEHLLELALADRAGSA